MRRSEKEGVGVNDSKINEPYHETLREKGTRIEREIEREGEGLQRRCGWVEGSMDG